MTAAESQQRAREVHQLVNEVLYASLALEDSLKPRSLPARELITLRAVRQMLQELRLRGVIATVPNGKAVSQ